jgi:hypothetical protein
VCTTVESRTTHTRKAVAVEHVEVIGVNLAGSRGSTNTSHARPMHQPKLSQIIIFLRVVVMSVEIVYHLVNTDTSIM